MPVPVMDDVKLLLSSREPAICQVLLNSWDRWWRNPERLVLFKRARATLIHNYMMIDAADVFAEDPGIRSIEGQETTFFVVEQ
jgi:hypothetical protein